MAAENAIEVSGLTKRYGTVTALDGVSFRVGRGELFGLIGPDGAGKTTLFRLLTTLLVPDAGFAAVAGWMNPRLRACNPWRGIVRKQFSTNCLYFEKVVPFSIRSPP